MAMAKFAFVGGGATVNISTSGQLSFQPAGVGFALQGGAAADVSESVSSGFMWIRPECWGLRIVHETGGAEAASPFFFVTDYIRDLPSGLGTTDAITVNIKEGQRGQGQVPIELKFYSGQRQFGNFDGVVRVWGRCYEAVQFTNAVEYEQAVFDNAAAISSRVLSLSATAEAAENVGGMGVIRREVRRFTGI